jgi:putative PIN family toxin of toxin-antitoxin system
MPIERRYVFDANVLVSALLLPDSVPRRAFDKARLRGKIILSDPVIAELDDVLRKPRLQKYLHDDERIQFLVALVREGHMVTVDAVITECRDLKDNRYLELACSGHATCIVSGDGDLLDLDPFRGIPIITPRKFLEGEL